jgi:phage-related protein
MEVSYFNRSVKKFIDSQEKVTRGKIIRDIMLLKQFGYMLSMPQSRKIMPHLYELRIRGVQEVRLFYTIYQDMGWILHGIVKKTNKIPLKELSLAKERLAVLTSI